MKSTASIQGHPIHAIVVAFPIAFLTGAFFSDLAGWKMYQEHWWLFGRELSLLGLLSGLMAALPGLVDYFGSIPPNSGAKKRATYHAVVNSGALFLFFMAFRIRSDLDSAPTTLLFEGLGLLLMGVGGWLGGTLVYKERIGVEPSYARGGTWNEEYIRLMSQRAIVVARSNELEIDQMKLVHVKGKRIVLARTAEGYVAFDDRCPHKGGSLADGALVGGRVQCPWHGSQFEVNTGAVKANPARSAIKTHLVEVSGSEIRLLL